MRITLINPPIKKIIEEIYDKPNYPNISIAYLAGYLEKNNISCKVIDAKLERLSELEVINKCINEDIVGISSFTHEINNSAELAKKIKLLSPNSKIVVGGPHVTALPKETIEMFPIFDFIVYGEGEETLYELIRAIEKGNNYEKVDGLVFRKNNKIIINKPRERKQNLDELAFPAWHLFPKAKDYPIITSRGCPFKCNFCMRPHGEKVRIRSINNVIEEMQILAEKYKPNYVYIWDETFTLFKDRTRSICNEMIKRGFHKKLKWKAETRVNCVDLEILQKMKQAGCDVVSFGIESGNPEILKNTKKGITIETAKEAVKMAKKAKLKTEGLFILGHPNETRKTMEDTISLAIKLNTTTVAFGIMTPYPGTEIYELAKKGEGGYKLLSCEWRDYNKQIGNALEFENISRKEIEKIQFLGYIKFYFYNFKIKEILKNIIRNHKLAFAIIKKVFKK